MKRTGGTYRIAGIALLFLSLVFFAALTQTRKAPLPESPQVGLEATDTSDLGIPVPDDPWLELQRLTKAYTDKGGMKYAGIMKLVDDNGDEEKELETTRFEYQVYGDDFYYAMGDIEVVYKGNRMLLADHVSRTITVTELQKMVSRKSVFDFRAFKKLMQASHAKAYVTQRGTEKVLTVDSIADDQIQGYRIYYDPLTYTIHRMVLGMSRPYTLDDRDAETETSESTPAEANPVPQEQGLEQYDYYLELTYNRAEKMQIREGGFHPEYRFFTSGIGISELTAPYKTFTVTDNSAIPETGERSEDY